ncbi:MAG TPA: hypothetical protein VF584_11650 [Longimicrobium sp.]|jgi:hypothetical protein
MARIGILCHLESLPRYREDVLHFSLNVTPVLVDVTGDEPWDPKWEPLLQPWSPAWGLHPPQDHAGAWERVLLWRGKGKPPVRGDVVRIRRSDSRTVEEEPLRRVLVERFEGLRGKAGAEDPGPFTWEPRPVTAESPLGERPKWHALLANAMRYPAPLPRALSLCCIFTVKEAELEDATELFAAPMLAEHAPVAEVDPEPLEATGIFTWELERTSGEGGPPLRAYSPPFPWKDKALQEEEEDAEKDFFDVARYWVKKPPEEAGHASAYSGDWSVELETRLAHGFDLAQRLVDFAREHDQVPLGTPYRDAVLAALRDTADTGLLPLEPARSRGSVAEDLLRRLRPDPSSDARLKAFLDALKHFEQVFWTRDEDQVERWRRLLVEAVPELAGLGILADEREEVARFLAGERRRAVDELDHLQSVLAREEVAGALLLHQWERAVRFAKEKGISGSAEAEAFWTDVAGPLRREVVPEVRLRERLLRASFASAWGRILRPVPTGESEREALAEGAGAWLRAHFRARFRLAPAEGEGVAEGEAALGAEYARRRPRTAPAELPAVLPRWLRATGRAFAESRALSPLHHAAPPATETPTGVTIQVARLAGATGLDGSEAGTKAEAEADWTDELRQVAGVGVLMREVVAGAPGLGDAGRWRCLNLADVHYGPRLPEAKGLLAVENVVAPWRLQYQGELRQAFVTYDNQPLIADSPATELAGPVEMAAAAPEAGDAELFEHKAPELGNSEGDRAVAAWAFLPALRFGARYEILPFLIGTGGALPAALADPEDPTCIVGADGFAFPGDAAKPPRSYVREVLYDRRVRVGRVRWGGLKSPTAEGRKPVMETLPLPRYPEEVVPLARDLAGNLGGMKGEVEPPLHRLPPVPGEQEEPGGDAPLALLWNDGRALPDETNARRYTFGVRKPAADLLTWDRWVAGGERTLEQRRKVWAGVHRENALRSAAPRGQNSPDATLDDPAVDGFFFQLFPLYARSPMAVPARRVARAAPALDGLEAEQAPALRVTCMLGEEGTPAGMDLNGSGEVGVRVPEGEIWELRIWATVPETAKLGPTVLRDAEHFEDPGIPGATVQCFSPLRLLIEGATSKMPDSTDLWRALDVAVDGAGRAVTVRLDPTSPGMEDVAPLLKKVELKRQLWRWNGRGVGGEEPPLEPAPLDPDPDAESPALSEAMRWEVGAFSDRTPFDYLLTAAEVSFTDPPGYRRSRGDVTLPGDAGGAVRVPPHPPLFREEFGGDRRARYYRFAVRAYSRYDALFAAGTGKSGHCHPDLPDPWRRGLARARPRVGEPVSPPLVRIVVPLTEAAGQARGEDRAAPPPRLGFLVVLNETWYDAYGFPEKLEASVEIARDPVTGETEGRLEMGADPILTHEGLDAARWDLRGFSMDAPAVDGVEHAGAALKLRGPIGYTFDTDSDAPLFVHSSFVLEAEPPPTLQGTGERLDLSWHFIKLRFRRMLPPRSIQGTKSPAHSEWTLPYWVQFLPDASRYSVRTLQGAEKPQVGLADLHLVLAGRRVQLQLRHEHENKDVDVELAPPPEPFQLWGVVTRRIRDVLGREQERFVALEPLRGGGCQIPEAVALPAGLANADLCLRIVEVQKAPRTPPAGGVPLPDPVHGGDLVDRMFGPDGEDAPLRIVRVSGAIGGGN